MIILGIESSCDETAVSIVEGKGDRVNVLANIVSSQIDIHKKYGGVVPEVAAREHVLHVLPVINEALIQAGIKKEDAHKKIKAIAATSGPGLITSLLAGTETAKALSLAWRLPLVPVNHVESHLYGNFIDQKKVEFPAIVLTVSGGHTILLLMTGHGKLKVLGETLDDAAGEAFDKSAQLMHLGYPGGPIISALADKFIAENPHHQTKIILPRPLLNKPNLDFSFSGLKTALLYQLQKDTGWHERTAEYAYELQLAIVETLVKKTIKAIIKYNTPTVILAGGVSANACLRKTLKNAIEKELPKNKLLLPDLKYTTDNAAMVATNGYFRFKNGLSTTYQHLKADPNLSL